MVDLESLSLKELKQLKKDVESAIANFKDREQRQALAEIEAFAREKGLTPAELAQLLGKRTRKPAKPKYANPDDPEQTWSGRGRRPRWVQDALESGKKLEDLAI
jgi:DNA-binding protein H-NS